MHVDDQLTQVLLPQLADSAQQDAAQEGAAQQDADQQDALQHPIPQQCQLKAVALYVVAMPIWDALFADLLQK